MTADDKKAQVDHLDQLSFGADFPLLYHYFRALNFEKFTILILISDVSLVTLTDIALRVCITTCVLFNFNLIELHRHYALYIN